MDRRTKPGESANQGTRPATPEHAALYARYSTDRQDSRSIEDQLRRGRVLADSRLIRIVGQYTDAAVSGSHMDRVDLQRLLADARRGTFRAVIIDDLSRLSRDLGDTWRIVFEDLASLGIKVIDATTGMSSDSPGARVTFGALALVNDTFLQMVKTETHRGLEGRALQGFATGGRTYGFATIQEENPPDLEHPRRVPIPNKSEAPIVRRIFELFAAGHTSREIAFVLNEEGVPAPHDGGPKGKRGNKVCRGWGHTTIRAILLNERYIGRWIWNQRRWVRVPGRNARRALDRPASEHVVTELPELRIVSEELWERVRQGFGPSRPGKGRANAAGKYGAPLLRGLLRCGVCGGSIVIVSRREKNGLTFANFGCTVNRSRGETICANNRTVSEKKVTRAVIDALTKQLTTSGLVERFRAAFVKRFDELNRGTAAAEDMKALGREVHDAETRVKNVTMAMAKIGFSEALAAQLSSEEARLAAARGNLAKAGTQTRPRVLPHPRVVEAYLQNLLTVLEKDKDAARALLSRHMPPLVLTPEGPAYRITGGFDLSICFGAEAEGPSGPSGASRSMIGMVAGA